MQSVFIRTGYLNEYRDYAILLCMRRALPRPAAEGVPMCAPALGGTGGTRILRVPGVLGVLGGRAPTSSHTRGSDVASEGPSDRRWGLGLSFVGSRS